MRVLVTGSTGFIGGHVVKELRRRGDDVRCLVRASSDRSKLEPLGVEFAVGDIRDRDSLAVATDGIDAVVHLASLLKMPWAPAFDTVNTQGAANVAAACAAQQTPPTLIGISSLAAGGPCAADEKIAETRAPRPISKYGRVKLAGETAMLQHADNVPISIVRPPAVFGPGDRTSFTLFRTASRGLHIVPHRGQFSMSLVDARDLSRAIALVLDRGERAHNDAHGSGIGIYYAAHESSVTYREFGELIGRALGRRRISVVRLPRYVTLAAAAIAEGVGRATGSATILSLDKYREATAGSWVCNSDKIAALGFATEPLAQRLQETASWYRQSGWL